MFRYPSVVTVTTTQHDARIQMGQLGRIILGYQNAGVDRLIRAMQVRIGMVALGYIRTAFVAKARGGADETGLSWPPIKRETVAYGRRHPVLNRRGQPTNRRIPSQGVRSQYRPSWMLTDKQRDQWWELYRQALARFRGDKGHAAAYAWKIMKSRGARTLIGVYGDTKVEILRDTGLLLTSLTPGLPESSVSSNPPTVKHQIFQILRDSVIIGTNRRGARAHHYGVPGRLPRRRLWPDLRRWPKSWWHDIVTTARDGVIAVALAMLRK